MLGQDADRVRCHEGRPTAEHVEQHNRARVQVASLIDAVTEQEEETPELLMAS